MEQLAEGPVFHPREERLYWVDILHPAIYGFDPATGVNETCNPGKLVSAVLPAKDNRLIVVTQDGIEYLDFATGQTTALANPEEGLTGSRLNDTKIGPGGTVWVGSMRLDASKATGGLFRVTERHPATFMPTISPESLVLLLTSASLPLLRTQTDGLTG